MMKKPANSLKKNANGDRISALPDSILSLILSYIPTTNAVATSVLSKRWKSLWKAVYILDFELDFCHKYCFKMGHKNCGKGWSVDIDMKFTRFVNHVLLLHDNGDFLYAFRLVWKPLCIPSQVISWINTAIAKNVHELFLCVDNSSTEPFEIPCSVFGSGTLKSLELEGNMSVSVSDSIVVCLPRLETIKLVSVCFQSEEALQKLISGCPVLNLLSINMDMDIKKGHVQTYRNTRTNLFAFIISSTSLRHLILGVVFDYELFEALPYCSLKLEAPSLEFLSLRGYVTRIFVPESLTSLVDAEFNIINLGEDLVSEASFCNSLVEAIRGFDSNALHLSGYASSALSRATIGLSTKFRRLTKLKIDVNCCYCSSLQDFIQSSDNLEELIVNGIEKESDLPHYDNFCRTHSNWTTPMEVPGCLSNSLKTVEFYEYDGFHYEREMISYMLMHGSVLEVMKIKCGIKRDDVKIGLLREICDIPRKSPACRVKFI